MSSLITAPLPLSRQNTMERPPLDKEAPTVPLSNTHFVFEDTAAGLNQMEVYRTLQILFRATLQDANGNVVTNWNEIDTWENRNQYRLYLPQQVIYKRYVGEEEYDEPAPPPSPYEGHGINEVVITRNSDEELEHWTSITGTEQDKTLLHRDTAGGFDGSGFSGRRLRQANIIEVAQAEAAVAGIGPVNVQQITSWDNIKF